MSEKIVERNSTEQFRSDYQRYGIYVTFSRVMPDYRDGLKPVQRRILWAMYNNSGATSRTVKCATIVGDVIGKYHPHGDAAVYGTIKPMTNWFESYLPTIQNQGSFGNFQGDSASAPRYTEAKLNKFSLECIIDEIRESPKCIDWESNFDNTLKEPAFLPVKIPLLLINGAFGIGLGKKTEIATHNTNEVIDATIALIQNPNAEITLVPDHCLRCEIVETDFRSISNTGYGYYKVRGVVEIGEYKGNTALFIRGTPNLVFLNSITDKIDELVEKKKLIQIQACYDESTEFDMKYVVVLKPGADPNYVRDVLYKETQLEKTERINFEVLNGLNAIRMSYKSYLLSFIDHRMITKFRAYTNRLQLIQTKIHEREIYIKVLESGEVDNIIKYIRKQKDTDDTPLIEYLINKLKITDLQAKFIINTDLRKLSKGYLNKYKEQVKELEQEKSYYLNMINNEGLIKQEIVNELLDAKAKYGHPRICKIVKERKVNEVPKGAMTVTITSKNFIKKVPKGTNIGNFKGDTIKTIIEADNSSSILIFDNMGKVFKLPIDKIPFVDNRSNGTDIRFLIKGLTSDIVTCIPQDTIRNGGGKDNINRSYLVCLTRKGYIKKMDDGDFINIQASGIRYVALEDDDFVVSVRLADDTMSFLVFSDRKVMQLPMEYVPSMKRNAKGNKTFRTDLVDGILDFYAGYEYILVVTRKGKVNKIPITSLPNIAIPKKESSVIKLGNDDSIFNIIPMNNNDVIRVVMLNEPFDMPVNDIPVGSSISTGQKLFNTRKDSILQIFKLLQ